MIDWLRMFLLIFRAPERALGEVRDRVPLVSAVLLAFVANIAYSLYGQWSYPGGGLLAPGSRPGLVFAVLFDSVRSLLFVALVSVPIMIFVANLFERRASFSLAVQQEYAPLASTVFYAWATATLVAFPVAILARTSGFQTIVIDQAMQTVVEWQRGVLQNRVQLASEAQLLAEMARSFSRILMLPLWGLLTIVAVRAVFRFAWARAGVVVVMSGIAMYLASIPLVPILAWISASPVLLLVLFFLLRGKVGDVVRAQRARVDFKRNLESATLNPADASAHYQLGLIHLKRGELEEARGRFERAAEIDSEEVDAYYQLGRIARAQNRLPEAIKQFGEVVARDPGHAQHDVWREIGATYIAAGQYADGYEAIERFLADRSSNPEGLYLMGLALAGLGRHAEAVESMRACIEAVKTAPAYNYHAEKRWLMEAQQFLRSQTGSLRSSKLKV